MPAKKQSKKVSENTPSFKHKFLNTFAVEKTFLVFAAVYFPISLLFLNRGLIAELSLSLYTIILMIVGKMMISKFLVVFAKFANEHKGQYGDLWVLYLTNALAPLLMFKYFLFVILNLLPRGHEGFLCEVKYFILDFIQVFNVGNTLSYLIVGSFVVMALVTLRSVGYQQK